MEENKQEKTWKIEECKNIAQKKLQRVRIFTKPKSAQHQLSKNTWYFGDSLDHSTQICIISNSTKLSYS